MSDRVGLSLGAADRTVETSNAEPTTGGLTVSRSLGLVVVLAGFVIGAAALADNSLLTHIATGRLILDQGSVPSTDPYSGPSLGLPWTVQSWLVSVVYATAERLVGPEAIRLIHGLVAAAVAGGLWQLTRPVGRPLDRFALVALPLLLGLGFWSPRPLMFGLLGMVALLQIIELRRPPILVVPLLWLWANSHGSFPLAFVLLGTMFLGAWADERAAGRSGPPAEYRNRWRSTVVPAIPGPLAQLPFPGPETWRLFHLGLLAAAGAAAAAIGPLGFRVLTFPFQLLGRREALDGVIEWQSPTFSTPWELLTLTLLPLMAVAARRGAGWRALGPSLVFFASALMATRNVAVASIVITVLMAPSLHTTWATIKPDAVNLFSRTLSKAAIVGLPVTAAAVMIIPALDLTWYPEEEVDFLEERGLVPTVDGGPVVLHREAVGNYLTFRYGADAAVFIDDRFDFHPQDVIDDHRVLLEGGDIADVLDRRNAQVVVWQADDRLSDWLAEDENWGIALTGDEWLIACRIDGTASTACFNP